MRTLRRLLRAGEVEEAAEFLSAWFGLWIPAEVVGKWQWPNYQLDSSLLTWAKCQLIAMEVFRPGYQTPEPIRLCTSLHFFFPRLYETPEMLAILDQSEYVRVMQKDAGPKFARSKMSTTTRKPFPVDKVAARVVGLLGVGA